MSPWTFTASAGVPGRFLIAATGYSTDGRNVDITTVRGVPTMITSFSSADPFGDASAVLSFPGITPLDDMDSIELRRWLRFYSDIDIYWAPATPAPGNADPVDLVIDPATNRANLTAPYTNAVKVWEGYIASMAFNDESGLEVSCQGALFQVDRYKAKPFFPNRPWPLEALIAEQFDLVHRMDPGGTGAGDRAAHLLRPGGRRGGQMDGVLQPGDWCLGCVADRVRAGPADPDDHPPGGRRLGGPRGSVDDPQAHQPRAGDDGPEPQPAARFRGVGGPARGEAERHRGFHPVRERHLRAGFRPRGR